ncbi:MAG TPA: hypothetical protein VLW85_01405 [Myxococcales bacterium]|nr:hypothetical protein [Myxococcales bacterium]
MDKQREAIESELFDVLQLDQDADEALAQAAGLIAEAEERFVKLARPALSKPPPA